MPTVGFTIRMAILGNLLRESGLSYWWLMYKSCYWILGEDLHVALGSTLDADEEDGFGWLAA